MFVASISQVHQSSRGADRILLHHRALLLHRSRVYFGSHPEHVRHLPTSHLPADGIKCLPLFLHQGNCTLFQESQSFKAGATPGLLRADLLASTSERPPPPLLHTRLGDFLLSCKSFQTRSSVVGTRSARPFPLFFSPPSIDFCHVEAGTTFSFFSVDQKHFPEQGGPFGKGSLPGVASPLRVSQSHPIRGVPSAG